MSGFDNGGAAPPPPPPPSAGGGGAIPQRGLGDILTTAFELYRANAAQADHDRRDRGRAAHVRARVAHEGALQTELRRRDNVQTFQDAQDFVNRCSGTHRPFLAARGDRLVHRGRRSSSSSSARSREAEPRRVLGRPVDVEASYRYAFSRLGGIDRARDLLIALAVFLGFFVFFIPAHHLRRLLRDGGAGVHHRTTRRGRRRCRDRGSSCEGIWWHTLRRDRGRRHHRRDRQRDPDRDRRKQLLPLRGSSPRSRQIITAPFVALVCVVLYIDLRVTARGAHRGSAGHAAGRRAGLTRVRSTERRSPSGGASCVSEGGGHRVWEPPRMTDIAALDPTTVRTRFPALARLAPDGRPYVWADAPGGSQWSTRRSRR